MALRKKKSEEKSFRDKLPPSLKEKFGVNGGPADAVLAAIVTDLTPEGKFGEEWLVATEERLQVYSKAHAAKNGALTLRFDAPLRSVESCSAVTFVVGGALHGSVNGGAVELARYSNSCRHAAGQFAKFVGDLTAHLRAEGSGAEAAPKPVWEASDSGKNCARCGILLPEGTSLCPACTNKSRVLLRLGRYLKPFWKKLLLLSALILAGSALALVTPYLTRPLMDVVLAPVGTPLPLEERMRRLFLILCGMFAAQVLGQVLGIYQGRAAPDLSHRLAHTLRVELYQHLQRLSLSFFDRRSVGGLITRITQDTKELESVLTLAAQFFAGNLLTLVGIIFVLCFINWRLFLYVALVIPLMVILSRAFGKRLSSLWLRAWHNRSRLSDTISDNLAGVKVVRAFVQEQREVRRFAGHSGDLTDASIRVEKAWMTMLPVLNFVTGLGALFVWLIGSMQVIGGKISLGVLLTFIAYLGMLYGPLQSVNRVVDVLGRALAAAERVFDILDTKPDVPDAAQPISLPAIEGRVEFRDVTFGHNPNLPVLHGINLQVMPGEMIGLVGHSGAGKSTLINLLCRFYDVDDGRILIDGVDIREIEQASLRSQIGLVLQETFLFNGTIAENVSFGRPSASMEEIIAAARAANAHHFIAAKPDGYDTVVGERGGALSGGERQRIAIARALLLDPRILILDEATSAMDTETERQIQSALSHLTKGRTTFAIAHRLSTLRHADRLVVLKEGRIEEQGTYDELIENRGEFYRLVEAQRTMSSIKAV